jgi:FMN reductase
MSSAMSSQPEAPFVVAISGSPSPQSKTAALSDYVLRKPVMEQGHTAHIRLVELDACALLRGDVDEPSIAGSIALIARAQGVLVATPIFKASFSGLLKVFLDLLPQFGLAGKVVLPLATGGSPAHVLALDYGLRPVLQSMGARHIVQGVFVPSSQVQDVDGRFALSPDSESLLAEAVLHFEYSMRAVADRPALLGHPRPKRATDLHRHSPLSV